jgi:osmotically-inducible protein OsmY
MYALVVALAAAVTFAVGTPLRASSETDDKIVSSFEKTYVYRTYLKDDAIKLQVKDGVVTLTGTVAEESDKSLAQETVAGLPAVTRVDNQLTVKGEAAPEHSDMWIGSKVKLALLFHRNVSASKTTVEVKDGVVTLKGEAANTAQKDLTTEYAKDIDGVKQVRNDMTVATNPAEPAGRTVGEKIDDASITAQVKLALLTHRSTSALKTGVATREGEVTLTGTAKNAAEKSLVSKLVEDINGVTGVSNQMTIAGDKDK